MYCFQLNLFNENRSDGVVLAWQQKFTAPIYDITSGDINADGVTELIVATIHGIHVLQVEHQLHLQVASSTSSLFWVYFPANRKLFSPHLVN
jgi:hypothetical protein